MLIKCALLRILGTGLHSGVTSDEECVEGHIKSEIYEWKNEPIENYAACTQSSTHIPFANASYNDFRYINVWK